MNPWVLALAAALKLYGVHRQDQHNKDLRRRRGKAISASREQNKKLVKESLDKSAKHREQYDPKVVARAKMTEADRLSTMLSKLPIKEYSVADPTRSGGHPMIAGARNRENKKALAEIVKHSGTVGDLTALTGAFNTGKQAVSRQNLGFDLGQNAREQQALAQILRYKLHGLSDPYSQEADISDKAGTLALLSQLYS
mgnify:FL=1